MSTLSSILWSSIGKKILMGLTGLALCVFVAVHLLGNLAIFFGAAAFNSYAHSLERLGPYLYIGELGLLSVFMIHTIAAVAFVRRNKGARPIRYQNLDSAGKPSRKSISSSTMIYTGVLLLIFTLLHLKTFKFGPVYKVEVEGQQMRDLYRLVVEVFQNKWYVIGYVAAMLMLGFHLRHGFWSAFQSLGAYDTRFTAAIYTVGILFAIVMTVGFVALPVWIYWRGGAP